MSPSKVTADAEPYKQPRTIDELLRFRRHEDPERTAVFFPVDKTQYKGYTMHQLDSYALSAAQHYSTLVPARQSSQEKPAIIAVQGSPDFAYLITLLAWSKLGHSPLLLSPRLSPGAVHHLLTATNAELLLVTDPAENSAIKSGHAVRAAQIAAVHTTTLHPLKDINDSNLTPTLDPEIEHTNPIWILHSSGSTGLPRAVGITHRSALGRYSDKLEYLGLNTISTLPLYHAHGMGTLFRAIYASRTALVYNLAVPITADRLVEITEMNMSMSMNMNMKAKKDMGQFELLSTVPFTLKTLAESEKGLQLLRSFRVVTSGGGPVGQALGDRLVEKGVRLVSIYGS